MDHALHRTIGKIIKDHFSSRPFAVLLDRACKDMQEERQNIPLFFLGKKSRATEICDVDILILKNGKIKAIFEIEESDKRPNQIWRGGFGLCSIPKLRHPAIERLLSNIFTLSTK